MDTLPHGSIDTCHMHNVILYNNILTHYTIHTFYVAELIHSKMYIILVR